MFSQIKLNTRKDRGTTKKLALACALLLLISVSGIASADTIQGNSYMAYDSGMCDGCGSNRD